MYGLTEASIIAFKSLVANMAPREYHPVRLTPDLWRHETLPTTFTLVVDDFGIKYFHTDQLTHFLNALRQNYRISMDLSGNDYCGLTLKWDYKKQFLIYQYPAMLKRPYRNFSIPILNTHNIRRTNGSSRTMAKKSNMPPPFILTST